jgi:hypothetical protein
MQVYRATIFWHAPKLAIVLNRGGDRGEFGGVTDPETSAAVLTEDDDARRTDEQWLVEFVADRDVACPACGYNLRQLTSARCPECGLNLRLTLRPADPVARAWITLTTLLCAAAGVGVLFALMLARRGWNRVITAERRHGIGAAVTLFFLSTIPIAALMLPLRRRFQRMPRAVQWRIAIVAAVVVAAGFYGGFAWMK